MSSAGAWYSAITPKFWKALDTASTLPLRSVPVRFDRSIRDLVTSSSGLPVRPSLLFRTPITAAASPNDVAVVVATVCSEPLRDSSSSPVLPVFARMLSYAPSNVVPISNRPPIAIPAAPRTPAPIAPAVFVADDNPLVTFLFSLPISAEAFLMPASLKVDRTLMFTAILDQSFADLIASSSFDSYNFTIATTSAVICLSPPALPHARQINRGNLP